MTGEITLRGRVLPIGGLKEKLLAAHRGGIDTVLIPKENEKDLKEIPAHVKRDLQIVLVEHMDEVLARRSRSTTCAASCAPATTSSKRSSRAQRKRRRHPPRRPESTRRRAAERAR